MARSKVGKALAARMQMPTSGKALEYWQGSAGQSVINKAAKDKSTKSKKMPIIERGRTKHEVKRGRWSGKSARLRVGGTFGS